MYGCGHYKKSKKPLSYKLGKSNYIHLTIDEGEMFIGRNNQQNEYLTHRLLNQRTFGSTRKIFKALTLFLDLMLNQMT